MEIDPLNSMNDEVHLRLENDKYYVLASSSYTDDQTKVLNNGDTFGIFDRWGDVTQMGHGVQGIYHEGTRFISTLQFCLNGFRPVLLSSNVKDENEILSIDLMNPSARDGKMEKGVLHVSRNKFLLTGICYEKILLQNFDIVDHTVECSLQFLSDFKDIFEVRGLDRPKRGTIYSPKIENSELRVTYDGLDRIRRSVIIHFSCNAEWINTHTAICRLTLPSSYYAEIGYSIQCRIEPKDPVLISYEEAFQNIQKNIESKKEYISAISTSNEQFTEWISRSRNDLISLLTETESGFYPYAGVPWYNTTFGRDGIITSLASLWVAPNIAKGVLLHLAATQAKELDPFRDAEPGKILHEARGGEMASLDEIPFKQYYGTVDATPLFIMLAGYYFRRTNDNATIKEIWDNIQLGIKWIEEYGDRDRDGFVEYEQHLESGLSNQGWKDSFDSVFHQDGSLAKSPITLCEVQGYVYDAYRQASYLAKYLGKDSLSNLWREKSLLLKKKFNEIFWDEELKTFVLALDRNKSPCRIKTSNPGHCLFTGIADKSKAQKMIRTLMQHDLFCGWGIRTLSSTSARYNPMSYHNGSVWPHDTAIIAAGMARYGYVDQSIELMSGLFSASLYIDLQRLPELFCGFSIRHGEAPTSYPVACTPQAWSVAAVYLLLQACLQINIDSQKKILSFDKPKLPDYLNRVHVFNLEVEAGKFELDFYRNEWDVSI
ncbi:MAG TPA: glycogen debranching N-terminal domain-containing protein, partial [Cyclobacteriaceae bacterium]|nr:glycogen debranching N-terminal domain-containing protein [Cyclobacteriaceae bacterium]